ncbi:MAG: aminoacyl-tRNA hydrolase, partial [Betaproteobacteria bacterium]
TGAVDLRYDAARCPPLPPEVLPRLLPLAGSRASTSGVILIDARVHRQQWRNRQDAIARLVELIRRAAVPRTPRIATRPGAAAQQRRVSDKRLQGERKKARRRPETND